MFTKRQRETLRMLRHQGAIDSKTAVALGGSDVTVAVNLAKKSLVNVRINMEGDVLFWLREGAEAPTGDKVACGYVIILTGGKEVTAPLGKKENFFLARTREADFTSATFKKHLQGWLRKLDLKMSDLISLPIEIVGYDSPVFGGGHLVLGDEDWKEAA